eukprot:gene36697-1257_t
MMRDDAERARARAARAAEEGGGTRTLSDLPDGPVPPLPAAGNLTPQASGGGGAYTPIDSGGGGAYTPIDSGGGGAYTPID